MLNDKNTVDYRATDVDGIPMVWIQPDNQDGDARIVLWVPWLTGTKETAIAFECGADDTHVPPNGALRIRDALAKAYPHAAAGVRVTLHPGTGHMDAAQKPAPFQNCLAWLAEGHTHP